MAFPQAVRTGFRNYANFKGYATRSEFWLWILFFALTAILASVLGTPFPANGAGPDTQVGIFTVHFGSIAWFELVQRLVLLLPTLAVLVRLLRDAGYGWGHVFWIFLPIGGLIVLIAFAASPSHRRQLVQQKD